MGKVAIMVSQNPSLNNSKTDEIGSFIKIKSRLFSILEWVLIKLKVECGEEVIMIAEKKIGILD